MNASAQVDNATASGADLEDVIGFRPPPPEFDVSSQVLFYDAAYRYHADSLFMVDWRSGQDVIGDASHDDSEDQATHKHQFVLPPRDALHQMRAAIVPSHPPLFDRNTVVFAVSTSLLCCLLVLSRIVHALAASIRE